MEKRQVKIRIDLIGTAPMDNNSVNLDNTMIDKIQTIRIYDEYLVTFVRQDIDGNDVYADPSGTEWFIFEDAVEATIEWLNKEVNE